MPTFDIDAEEFLDNCSRRELNKIISYLVNTGEVLENAIIKENYISLQDKDINNFLNKISENRLRLTVEEEQILKNIANRF